MKKLIFLMMMFLCSAAHATTMTLNDGRVINADNIFIYDEEIIAETNGIDSTYYPEQVKSINGKPFTPKEPAPDVEITSSHPDVKIREVTREEGRAIMAARKAERATPPPIDQLTEEDKTAIKAAYIEYQEAFKNANSLADLKDVLVPEQYTKAQEALQSGGMSEIQLMGMMKMMTPPNPEIKDVILKEGKALLLAEAMGPMGKGKAEIEFIQTNGIWKVFEAHWTFGETPKSN